MGYDKKTVSFDGSNLMVKFSASNKDEFYSILQSVKALEGREFMDIIRRWKVPPFQDNIDSLDSLGFHF